MIVNGFVGIWDMKCLLMILNLSNSISCYKYIRKDTEELAWGICQKVEGYPIAAVLGGSILEVAVEDILEGLLV